MHRSQRGARRLAALVLWASVSPTVSFPILSLSGCRFGSLPEAGHHRDWHRSGCLAVLALIVMAAQLRSRHRVRTWQVLWSGDMRLGRTSACSGRRAIRAPPLKPGRYAPGAGVSERPWVAGPRNSAVGAGVGRAGRKLVQRIGNRSGAFPRPGKKRLQREPRATPAMASLGAHAGPSRRRSNRGPSRPSAGVPALRPGACVRSASLRHNIALQRTRACGLPS